MAKNFMLGELSWMRRSGQFAFGCSRSVLPITSTSPCRISWLHQMMARFPLDDHSVDVIGAFSVFTHLEHEDSYLYLKDALRVIKPGGRGTNGAKVEMLTCATRSV